MAVADPGGGGRIGRGPPFFVFFFLLFTPEVGLVNRRYLPHNVNHATTKKKTHTQKKKSEKMCRSPPPPPPPPAERLFQAWRGFPALPFHKSWIRHCYGIADYGHFDIVWQYPNLWYLLRPQIMLLMSGRNDARRLRGVILSGKKTFAGRWAGMCYACRYCQTIIVFILSCPWNIKHKQSVGKNYTERFLPFSSDVLSKCLLSIARLFFFFFLDFHVSFNIRLWLINELMFHIDRKF